MYVNAKAALKQNYFKCAVFAFYLFLDPPQKKKKKVDETIKIILLCRPNKL